MKAIKVIIQIIVCALVYIVQFCAFYDSIDFHVIEITAILFIDGIILIVLTILAMEKFGKWFDSKLKQDEEKS